MAKKFKEDVAKQVSKLFELCPMDLLTPTTKETTAAMREALARLYGDTAMRQYLENSVRESNRKLIASSDEMVNMFYKSRIETLMQILAIGKNHYIHAEIKRSMREPLRAIENQIAEIKL